MGVWGDGFTIMQQGKDVGFSKVSDAIVTETRGVVLLCWMLVSKVGIC